jgi:hypothetical protein
MAACALKSVWRERNNAPERVEDSNQAATNWPATGSFSTPRFRLGVRERELANGYILANARETRFTEAGKIRQR